MKFLLIFTLIFSALAVEIPKDEEVLRAFGRATKKTLPEKDLQLLIWNLHKGSNKGFDSEFVALAQNKHVLLTQEILLNTSMLNTFAAITNTSFLTATSFFIGKDAIRTGIATASNTEMQNYSFLRTKNAEPVIHSPKMALFSQYKVENHKELLTVVNLHAINFVESKVFKEEIDRLANEILRLKLNDKPLIVAGDFNTWSEERLNILNEFKSRFKLNETDFAPDHRLTFRGYPLDHVLYSNHLELVSAKAELQYQGSDHRPMEVVFNVLAE